MCSVSPLLDLVWQSATRFFTPICNFVVSFLSAASARFDKITIGNTTRIPHKRRILSIKEKVFFLRLNWKKFSKKRIESCFSEIPHDAENEQAEEACKDEMTWLQGYRCSLGGGECKEGVSYSFPSTDALLIWQMRCILNSWNKHKIKCTETDHKNGQRFHFWVSDSNNSVPTGDKTPFRFLAK